MIEDKVGHIYLVTDHTENAFIAYQKDGTGKCLNQSGFVIILHRKSHRVLSAPGGSQSIYKDEQLQPLFQSSPVFHHVHDLYVDAEENIYIGEWSTEHRYPFKLELVRKEQ